MNTTRAVSIACAFLFSAVASLACPQSPTSATSEGSGPCKAVMESDPALPTHTVYRPKDLDKIWTKLPIVAFGNSGCANNGAFMRKFLTEIASHGFLVVAIGPAGEEFTGAAPKAPGGGQGPATQPPLPSQLPPVATKSSQLIDGINWAIASNADPASKLQGRLDTEKIAVMGQSCGGLQALEVSGDPRIRTTVLLNSGVFKGGQKLPGLAVTKETLKSLHAPIAYFIGGPSDIAYPNALDDFELIQGVPAFLANLDVGHMATYAEPNGGKFGEVVGAWLKWQLKDDQKAGTMFVGPQCGLCSDPKWKVEWKNRR